MPTERCTTLWSQVTVYNCHFKLVRPYLGKILSPSKYSQGSQIPATVFNPIIDADIFIRQVSQRIERYEQKISTLRKAKLCDPICFDEDDSKGSEEYVVTVQSVDLRLKQRCRVTSSCFLQSIYERSTSRSEKIDLVVCDELVQDCISRGGCCGRQCKCCDIRHLPVTTGQWRPGTGHCTVECKCCEEYRGFPYTEAENQENPHKFPFTATINSKIH